MGHLPSSSSSPPFLSGWQKKRGRPLRGGEMLFWAAGPAGPILARSLRGPQWAGPPPGGCLSLWILRDLCSCPRHHVAPVVKAFTTAHHSPRNWWNVLNWWQLYKSLTLNVSDKKDLTEPVVTNEGLMKLGPELPDECGVTSSRRISGKLKPYEDPHSRQSVFSQDCCSWMASANTILSACRPICWS